MPAPAVLLGNQGKIEVRAVLRMVKRNGPLPAVVAKSKESVVAGFRQIARSENERIKAGAVEAEEAQSFPLHKPGARLANRIVCVLRVSLGYLTSVKQ